MRLLALALLLAGCASVPSFSDALGVGYLTVDTLAVAVFEACGNKMPGGECAYGAPIATEQKDRARSALQEALDILDEARWLYAIGEAETAGDRLQQARALLRGVENLLVRVER
jgi:hypothetical protein